MLLSTQFSTYALSETEQHFVSAITIWTGNGIITCEIPSHIVIATTTTSESLDTNGTLTKLCNLII